MEIYKNYLKEQNNYPQAILLYQVGDFYEVMGENAPIVAEHLDLVLTQRTVNDVNRVPMVGMPSNRLETYMNMLLDRGFDVALSTVEEDGSRKNVLVSSGNKEEPVNSFPVGRIDYLSSDGKVRESIEYTSEYQFVKDIKEELYYGVPLNLVFYRDENSNTISRDFLDSLDTMPAGSEIINSPYNKRFGVVDTFYDGEKDNQWAVYDFEKNETYVDRDHLIHSFATKEEAEEYYKKVLALESPTNTMDENGQSIIDNSEWRLNKEIRIALTSYLKNSNFDDADIEIYDNNSVIPLGITGKFYGKDIEFNLDVPELSFKFYIDSVQVHTIKCESISEAAAKLSDYTFDELLAIAEEHELVDLTEEIESIAEAIDKIENDNRIIKEV